MSTETPYTTGPYYIRREQRARDTLVEIRGSTEISPMGPLVAVVKSALKRTDADADLLAASWDMAQALRSVLASPRDASGEVIAVAISREDWDACSAALRKAGVLP